MSQITISGIAAWAHVSKASGEKTIEVKGRKTTIASKYSIDVLLEPSEANRLKKEGFNVKKVTKEISGIENSVGMGMLQVKKPEFFQDGNKTPAPVLVDSSAQPFDGLIGNGSKVNVMFDAMPYELMGNSGISARLSGVQVVELVEYSSAASVVFSSVAGGFVAEKEAAPSPAAVFSDIAEEQSTISSDQLDF